MSMPMLVSELEETAPIAPMLRLADDVVDDVETTDAPAAAIRVVEGRLIADDAATLPEMCVRCGDTVGLTSLVTPRGHVGFSLCREHRIGGLALAAGGAIVSAIASLMLVLGDGIASKLGLFVCFSTIGVGLVASALPIATWQDKAGARRLFRVHRDVVAAIARQSR